MTGEIDTAVILGAGNIAWHLGHFLSKSGITVVQVYNRSREHGKKLAISLKADFTDTADKLEKNAGIYFLAISDDAIKTVVKQLTISKDRLLVHTAGGVDMNVISGITENYGVFYPLQTFSKERHVDFTQIPLLVEANNTENLGRLKQLALTVSRHVYEMGSEDRMILHLAAVIASNFSNHLIACAENILKDRKLALEMLKPLMVETVAKAFAVTPGKAQTGPAVRGNFKLMEKHMAMLRSYPEIKEIYRLISDNIIKFKN